MNFQLPATSSKANHATRSYPKQPRVKSDELPTVRLEQRPAGNWVTFINGGHPFPSTQAEIALWTALHEAVDA